MRIVLVNYRYFVSGGPERYLFNVKSLLKSNGHEVFPFSIKNSLNFESDFEDYFVDSVDDAAYFKEGRKSLKSTLKSILRLFFSIEVQKKFQKFLQVTKPDLVFILQYHNKMSPSVIYAAKKLGIPIVHRISDFQYMCPNALFFNEVKGICEDCLEGRYYSCIKYKCVHGSKVYSALKLGAKLLHDYLRITNKIDAFVVPSSFTAIKLKQYGISEEFLNHIPSFFNEPQRDLCLSYEPYFLYIGRIEKQKGLMTLVKAFEDTKYSLKIIGFSSDGYDDFLKNYLVGKKHCIDFLGRMTFDEIVPFLQTCMCTIVPSEWYDNLPNTILESYAFRKPVIATNIGSLPEIVNDGKTGILFEYGDALSLRSKLEIFINDPQCAQRYGEQAYSEIQNKYSAEAHYEKLMELFDHVVN